LTFTFHSFAGAALRGRFLPFVASGFISPVSNFKSIGQGVRGLQLPKSGISHWLWMSLLQQCYALTCYTVKVMWPLC